MIIALECSSPTFLTNTCGSAPPPPLEWNSILPLVTTVLITLKGAEPPGSRRIGVLGALVLILPSETV